MATAIEALFGTVGWGEKYELDILRIGVQY